MRVGILFIGIYPREVGMYIHVETGKSVHTTVLFIITENRRKMKSPSTATCRNYNQLIKCEITRQCKKDGMLVHGKVRLDLKHVVLGKGGSLGG